jgi:6-carboxyhexanoate--CoA ligase
LAYSIALDLNTISDKTFMNDTLFSVRMRASLGDSHVSGGEGIYGEDCLVDECSRLLNRALSRRPEVPDTVNIAIEKLRSRPVTVPLLPLVTCRTIDTVEAGGAAVSLLKHIGIGDKAIEESVSLLEKGTAVAGALLIDMVSGERFSYCRESETGNADGSHKNGFSVRVSRFGLSREGRTRLSKRLSGAGLTHHRVIEALQIASKVASYPYVEAELCISDDSGYTTGYVASRKYGYVRIPHIKAAGSPAGGRVFFLGPGVQVAALVEYLKKTPVIIDITGQMTTILPGRLNEIINGEKTIGEILGTPYS